MNTKMIAILLAAGGAIWIAISMMGKDEGDGVLPPSPPVSESKVDILDLLIS